MKNDTADELWRQAIVDHLKTMNESDFAELTRQRQAASQPAPTAGSLPTAPRMSAQDSIAAKREQARALGRTAL